jgi:hypothetical protein
MEVMRDGDYVKFEDCHHERLVKFIQGVAFFNVSMPQLAKEAKEILEQIGEGGS